MTTVTYFTNIFSLILVAVIIMLVITIYSYVDFKKLKERITRMFGWVRRQENEN